MTDVAATQTEAAPENPEAAGAGAGGDNAATEQAAQQAAAEDTAAPGEGEAQQGSTEGDAAEIEYEPFNIPDGFAADEQRTESFVAWAREQGLDQQTAQAVVNYGAQQEAERMETYRQEVEGWAEQARQDPELAGETPTEARFNESLDAAQRALETFGDDEVREILTTYGIGNHPAMVRMYARIGRQMIGDTIDVSDGPTSSRASKSAAQRIFRNQN